MKPIYLIVVVLLWLMTATAADARHTEIFGAEPQESEPAAAPTAIPFVAVPVSVPPAGQFYYATVTAYSCDPHRNNPMGACHTFADGTSAIGAAYVVACPREWRGGALVIYGATYICRDTPRVDWYGNSPHIDIYMGSHSGAHLDAVTHGIRYEVPVEFFP